MKFIKTFESYLKGGRAPLYHFLIGDEETLHSIISDDTLKMGFRGRDMKMRKQGDVGYVPSISVTRNKRYGSRGSIRIELDNDLLFEDKYIAEPFDEMGAAISHSGRYIDKYSKHMNPFYGFKTVRHGDSIKIKTIPGGMQLHMEEEYEERFYKNIENLGKYIISIKLNENSEEFLRNRYQYIIEYIKKYPHIKILNKNDKLIYDIDMIRKEENQRLDSITISQ